MSTENLKSVNYKGYTVFEDGQVIGLKGKLLKPGLSSSGYYTVCICEPENKIKKSVCIHRLIAECFIPNPENKIYINHINSIRTDNRIENLEWVTPSENAIHMVKNGRAINTINSLKKRMSKKVLDSSSGKIYPSLKLASLELGFNRKTLAVKLSGHRKNNTSLSYL